MATAVLGTDVLGAISDRLQALKPETPRKWGSLDAHRLLTHLTFALRLSLGEEEGVDESTFMSRNIVKPLALYVLPWPRGKLKVPDQWTSPPKDTFEAERSILLETMQRFVDTAEREPDRVSLHPFFGPLSLRTWKRLHALHINHHLNQFGV